MTFDNVISKQIHPALEQQLPQQLPPSIFSLSREDNLAFLNKNRQELKAEAVQPMYFADASTKTDTGKKTESFGVAETPKTEDQKRDERINRAFGPDLLELTSAN